MASLAAGCAVVPEPIQPTLRGLWQYVWNRDSTAGVTLNPALRYLRVTIDGQVSLFVLGELDADPRDAARPAGAPNVPTEVWFSGLREVLRLRDGRVMGVSGVSPEWRNVELRGAPAWAQLAGRSDVVVYSRLRDAMPGYHYGINDQLTLRHTAPPARSQLAGLEAKNLVWFEETVAAQPSTNAPSSYSSVTALPPARYAVELRAGQATVVYGEQCLATTVCFTWQRWPPDARAP